MKRHDETFDRNSLKGVTGHRRGRPLPFADATPASSSCAYGRAAHALALEDGLLSEEIEEILGGRRMVAAFPIGWRESPQEYAARAVAELMVAYLAFEAYAATDEIQPWSVDLGEASRATVREAA